MQPARHSDPTLAQLQELPDTRNTLLLDGNTMTVSTKGAFGRTLAKVFHSGEARLAGNAVTYLRETLELPLSGKSHISVRSAQKLITQPEYDLDTINMASGLTDCQISTFDSDVGERGTVVSHSLTLTTGSTDEEQSTALSRPEGAIALPLDLNPDQMQEEPVKKKKSRNVSFAEQHEEIPPVKDNEPFDAIIQTASESDNFSGSVATQYDTMSPEKMCEFRQYLNRTYEKDELKEHLSDFMQASRMNVALKLLEKEFVNLSKEGLQTAVHIYSTDPQRSSLFIQQFRWMMIHYTKKCIPEIAHELSDFLKRNPTHFDAAHEARTKEIKSRLDQIKIADIIRQRITQSEEEATSTGSRLRTDWTRFSSNIETKEALLKELGLPELAKNDNAHHQIQDITLGIKNEVMRLAA